MDSWQFIDSSKPAGTGVVAGELAIAKGIFIEGEPVGESLSVDLSGLRIFPGFIDVHNHGAVGIDVNEANVDGLLKIAAFLATRGVTVWMPTLVPDSDETYRRVIDAVDELMVLQTDRAVAQAVGVHYEGVFATEQMCGALRPQYFKCARDLRAIEQLPRLRKGRHMTTLAPEIAGGIALVEKLVKQGWIVSIGHTKADIVTLDAAVAAGARHMTHFFNAMTGVHHREVGVAGWGLMNSEVTFDIIADGIHVHPDMLCLACRTKGIDKVSLISDSVAPTGLGDGEFELWDETISVSNGRTRNERGSIAGSVITMLDAVKRMHSIGFTVDEVAMMASANPAKLLGIEAFHGSIEVGKRADLVAVDGDGNIRFTIIGGRLVQ